MSNDKILRIPDSIKDLLYKCFITSCCLAVYNFCSAILLPGTNLNLQDNNLLQDEDSFLAVLNQYSRGGFQGSILFLGIGPYISASIVTQILFSLDPGLKEEKKDNPSMVNEWTRLLSLPLSLIQAVIHMAGIIQLDRELPQFKIIGTMGPLMYGALGIVSLVAGTYFCLFIADMIGQYGLGNGSSVLIVNNILSRLSSYISSIVLVPNGLLVLLVSLILTGMFIAQIELSYRNVPITFPNALSTSKNPFVQESSVIPFKLNQNGVIAPIVAQNLLSVGGFVLRKITTFLPGIYLINPSEDVFNFLSLQIILLVSVVFLEINANPEETAETLHKSPFSIINSTRPGARTANELDILTKKLCLVGALYVVFLDLLPGIVGNVFLGGLPPRIIGLDLLIVLGTLIDIIQTAETYWIPRDIDLESL